MVILILFRIPPLFSSDCLSISQPSSFCPIISQAKYGYLDRPAIWCIPKQPFTVLKIDLLDHGSRSTVVDAKLQSGYCVTILHQWARD